MEAIGIKGLLKKIYLKLIGTHPHIKQLFNMLEDAIMTTRGEKTANEILTDFLKV